MCCGISRVEVRNIVFGEGRGGGREQENLDKNSQNRYKNKQKCNPHLAKTLELKPRQCWLEGNFNTESEDNHT